MLLSSLVLIPIMGILSIVVYTKLTPNTSYTGFTPWTKYIALTASSVNLFISIIIFILFDFSTNQFQFVQEYHNINYFDFYLGIDGLSIYFVLLTTIIIPISLLSLSWNNNFMQSYFIIILLLESLLLLVFLVLDILLFYIFFESILPPLFLLIGLYGSDNRIKASFYLFLYTLLGSLFLLLSILAMSSIMSATDFDSLFKKNFIYLTQVFLFYGIFIAFAVKTPTIFLNTWLLKAHVESPLGGSIILAAIVLKLSLYGILRLILPVLPKAFMVYTYIVFIIGVITIVYASISTLRTIDVKELIAYSSVSHAAVYLIGVFSNSIQGIEGGISLGLAHGFISPGLFIVAGGVLYDRYHTRLISFYTGMAQQLPLLSLIFFILCLGNCGAPLTLNFIGEFMSLYGVFERSSLFGVFASSSIVFSAAYTIYMYQRISFGGQFGLATKKDVPGIEKHEWATEYPVIIQGTHKVFIEEFANLLPNEEKSKLEKWARAQITNRKDKTLEDSNVWIFEENNIVKPDINERECIVLLTLVVLPVMLGIYGVPILDAIHYSCSGLLYIFDSNMIICTTPIVISSFSKNTFLPDNENTQTLGVFMDTEMKTQAFDMPLQSSMLDPK
jgi:NADH-ubiquinone oxidoreductase chain 4